MASNALNSTALERDARAIHQHGERNVSPGEIAIGVIIGRTSEFFDFFVYAIASVIVFPQLVFPQLSRLDATLWSFAIFSLAFIARPVGSAIFLSVDRHFGRGTKLTIALFLLGVSTVSIGFLPGYAQVGAWSALILCVLRIGQGLALAGAWDGLASLLAINAPEDRRGWYAMIPQLGAPLGLMVASGLFAYLLANLSAADFYDWGWRYPFFVAFALNVVALFARLRMVVAPEYEELFKADELRPSRITRTLRSDGWKIVIGTFAPLASFALFHLVTVFPLSWIVLFTQESATRFLLIEMAGALICLCAIVASGVFANQFGRRSILAVSAAAIAVFSGFAPQLLGLGEGGAAVFMFLGFVLLGMSFGQSSGAVASSFSPGLRYTGSALTSDLAWLFGAGFAPLVALLLATKLGLFAAGLYLLSGAIATLVALYVNKNLAGKVGR